MFSICFVYNKDSAKWCEFLANILSKKRLKLKVYGFEESKLSSLAPKKSLFSDEQKAVVIVLASPGHLLFLKNSTEFTLTTLFGEGVVDGRAFLFLCGSEEAELSEKDNLGRPLTSRFPDFKKWKVFNSDEHRALLKSAVETVENFEIEEARAKQGVYDIPKAPAIECKQAIQVPPDMECSQHAKLPATDDSSQVPEVTSMREYSPVPKMTVTCSQDSEVSVMDCSQVTKVAESSCSHVTLDPVTECNQVTQDPVTKCNLGTTSGFNFQPERIRCEEKTTVLLLFDDQVTTDASRDFDLKLSMQLPDDGQLQAGTAAVYGGSEDGSVQLEPEFINPYTFSFTVPEYYKEDTVTVRVCVNGVEIGKKPLYYYWPQLHIVKGFMQIHMYELSRLCDYFQRRRLLDAEVDHLLAGLMTEDFTTSIPVQAFEQLFSIHSQSVFKKEPSTCELPTLLHFAAKYGFDELALSLSDLPDSNMICQLPNVNGHTPDQLALLNGHKTLADMLSKLKTMPQEDLNLSMDRRPSEPSYSAPGSNTDGNFGRIPTNPVTTPDNHFISPDNESSKLTIKPDRPDYLDMSGRRVDSDMTSPMTSTPDRATYNDEEPIYEKVIFRRPCSEGEPCYYSDDDSGSQDGDSNCSLKRDLSQDVDSWLKRDHQDELVKIMEQVKNKELTIADAEVLFNDWKLRNENSTSHTLTSKQFFRQESSVNENDSLNRKKNKKWFPSIFSKGHMRSKQNSMKEDIRPCVETGTHLLRSNSLHSNDSDLARLSCRSSTTSSSSSDSLGSHVTTQSNNTSADDKSIYLVPSVRPREGGFSSLPRKSVILEEELRNPEAFCPPALPPRTAPTMQVPSEVSPTKMTEEDSYLEMDPGSHGKFNTSVMFDKFKHGASNKQHADSTYQNLPLPKRKMSVPALPSQSFSSWGKDGGRDLKTSTKPVHEIKPINEQTPHSDCKLPPSSDSSEYILVSSGESRVANDVEPETCSNRTSGAPDKPDPSRSTEHIHDPSISSTAVYDMPKSSTKSLEPSNNLSTDEQDPSTLSTKVSDLPAAASTHKNHPIFPNRKCSVPSLRPSAGLSLPVNKSAPDRDPCTSPSAQSVSRSFTDNSQQIADKPPHAHPPPPPSKRKMSLPSLGINGNEFMVSPTEPVSSFRADRPKPAVCPKKNTLDGGRRVPMDGTSSSSEGSKEPTPEPDASNASTPVKSKPVPPTSRKPALKVASWARHDESV